MAVQNPMSNFNRKNPYVIQAKQQYNFLLEEYEEICKTIIVSCLSVAVVFAIMITVNIINKSIFEIVTQVIMMSSYIYCTYSFIKNTIKDDINSEIDHMVTLESNEIMNIDITYVQELLYTIHNRIGKTHAWHTCYKVMSSLYIMIIVAIH